MAYCHGQVARLRPGRLRPLHSWHLAMLHIDAIWLTTEPMDMPAGTDTALARVVALICLPTDAPTGLNCWCTTVAVPA